MSLSEKSLKIVHAHPVAKSLVKSPPEPCTTHSLTPIMVQIELDFCVRFFFALSRYTSGRNDANCFGHFQWVFSCVFFFRAIYFRGFFSSTPFYRLISSKLFPTSNVLLGNCTSMRFCTVRVLSMEIHINYTTNGNRKPRIRRKKAAYTRLHFFFYWFRFQFRSTGAVSFQFSIFLAETEGDLLPFWHPPHSSLSSLTRAPPLKLN